MPSSSRAVAFLFVAFLLVAGLLVPASAAGPAPDWNEWMQRGQAARDSGNLAEAALAFSRARSAQPVNPISTRAACEVARMREEKGEPGVSSREPCHNAMSQGTLAEDFANEVGSLTALSAPLPFEDLPLATLTAEAAEHVGPDQPWGAYAECAIARRLGSAGVMSACLEKVRRFSPDHPATRLALALTQIHTSPLVWVLRALLLLGFLGTLTHALASRRRRAPKLKPSAGEAVSARAIALLLMVIGGTLLAQGTARAEPRTGKHDLSDFVIDEANPEASVPGVDEQNKHPLEFGYFLQDLAARYEKAVAAEDHAASVRYLRALTKAAPTAFAPRMLCEEYEKMGDLVLATNACRTAVTRKGTNVGDIMRLVHVALAQPGPLPKVEQYELNTQIDYMASQSKADSEIAKLRCDVAIRFHDVGVLQTCSDQLAKVAPNDPGTVSYLWALAIEKHDGSAAAGLIQRARETGMSEDGVAKMESATRQMGRRRIGRLVVLGLVLVGLVVAGRWLSSRRRVTVATPPSA